MSIPIDLTITKTNKVNSFEIANIELVLNSYASLYVCLKNDDIIVETLFIKIEGEQYDNWGNDDQYIIDYVRNYIINYFVEQ